jgi:hypothetical protein
MSHKKIEKLAQEQEALIPLYREKWRSIALSTERIERQKAASAVKEAYALSSLHEPEIVFFDSPYAALNSICIHQLELEGKQVLNQLVNSLFTQLLDIQLDSQLHNELNSQLCSQLDSQLHNELNSQLCYELGRQMWLSSLGRIRIDQMTFIAPEVWACNICWVDFYISVLNFTHAHSKWSVIQSLVKNCGWIYPYEKIAIVCDRPCILCFDNQQRLHAEGKPAIQFADGYSIYAYHGVTLPEKYGTLHPNQWQAKWFLEEDNIELRQVLIQGIGYEQITQELGATDLDSL